MRVCSCIVIAIVRRFMVTNSIVFYFEMVERLYPFLNQ